jgi:hypothetical protein
LRIATGEWFEAEVEHFAVSVDEEFYKKDAKCER